MDSINHYAYGVVADWKYECATRIHPVEEPLEFERVMISSQVDSRYVTLMGKRKSKTKEMYVLKKVRALRQLHGFERC